MIAVNGVENREKELCEDIGSETHEGSSRALGPLAFGFFFFFLKNMKNTKMREYEQFLKNTKMVFFMFSKTILNNNFQNQKPNWPDACT